LEQLHDDIWQIVVRVGRYGRQPADWVMSLPITRLYAYCDGLRMLAEVEEAERSKDG
jgi:hypothetical protein